jgi:signal transduction histidine kinase
MGSLHAFIARTFRGVTWARVAFVCAAIVIVNLGNLAFYESGAAWSRMVGNWLLMTFGILLAVVAVDNHVTGSPGKKIAALALAVALGGAAGVALAAGIRWLTGLAPFPGVDRALRTYGVIWMWGMGVGAVAAAAHFFLARSDEAEAAAYQESLDRLRLAGELTQTRMKVLQAQIEPHFLFNTLAHVRRLYETDAGAGRTMLRHLSSYLTATLPSMRQSVSTLERELAITVAYLNVQQIRMERRLAFTVDLPEPLRAVPFPPMMILTLAENAIRHGLGPLPEGGHVAISARADTKFLRVEVADNGRGLAKNSGPGVGLTNIRGRLRALYASNGRLILMQNPGRGVTATIEIPFGAPA